MRAPRPDYLSPLAALPDVTVSANSAAHMVSPKPEGTKQRLACSWFFKKASNNTGLTSSPYCAPPALCLAAAEGELPEALTAVLRNTFDPALTAGNTD